MSPQSTQGHYRTGHAFNVPSKHTRSLQYRSHIQCPLKPHKVTTGQVTHLTSPQTAQGHHRTGHAFKVPSKVMHLTSPQSTQGHHRTGHAFNVPSNRTTSPQDRSRIQCPPTPHKVTTGQVTHLTSPQTAQGQLRTYYIISLRQSRAQER